VNKKNNYCKIKMAFTIIVGNLSPRVNEKDLMNLLGKIGPISKIEKKAGLSEAKITFSDWRDAQTAYSVLDGADYYGKPLVIRFPWRSSHVSAYDYNDYYE
jgi:RNA recognition motif-containing protein